MSDDNVNAVTVATACQVAGSCSTTSGTLCRSARGS